MSIRLAHLSDVHFGGENPGACAAALEIVERFAPDLVAVTGDLTLNGLPREFEAARAWLDRLPGPQLVTPGNHDTPYWNIPLRALVPFNRYNRFIGPPQHTKFLCDGLCAHAVNSARGAQPRLNWSKGAIDLRLVTAVIAEMAAAQGALKVFACHHPLIDPDGAPVTGSVRRGDAAARLLAEAGIDLILTGHVHNPFALAVPGSTGRSYAIGAGTLSLRTRGTPASFSLIEADASVLTVTALGWTGAEFQPNRTWTLERGLEPVAAGQP
ncbi:metallophosphoesterase family protein [Phenylobacterium montanum]|uniref:Metallophosphoesterase n=1 Tax=Phenylobacterium montanum TaxID=2823693 RepID=A0A975FZZ6_9CAUL|nr:metallophosphoesterase [Caulobacter sp. S6]QUD88281.1 metallophosphoesterase [Caulobacter sp. S6]